MIRKKKWLNQMSAKGLQLVGVGLFNFTFEEGTPNEYGYKLELLENVPSHLESVQYIRFLEEAQVEYIGSFMRWAYFRAKTKNNAFELYSDIEPKIKQNNRIIARFVILIPICIYWAVINLNNYISYHLGLAFFVLIANFLLAGLLSWGLFVVLGKNRKLRKQKRVQE